MEGSGYKIRKQIIIIMITKKYNKKRYTHKTQIDMRQEGERKRKIQKQMIIIIQSITNIRQDGGSRRRNTEKRIIKGSTMSSSSRTRTWVRTLAEPSKGAL